MRMLQFLAMFVALFVSAQAYGQKTQMTLDLGAFEVPDVNALYSGSVPCGSPVLYDYPNSATQTIYTADQLTAINGKEITSISFIAHAEGCYVMDYASTMKVYLHEIDATEFPKNGNNVTEWLATNAESNLTVEYTANFYSETTEGGYGDYILKFDFTAAPYKYTGKTLVVTIVNEEVSAELDSGALTFYHMDAAATTRSILFANRSDSFAKNQEADNLVADDDEKELTEAPVVRFTYQEAEAPAPTFPEKLYGFGDFEGHVWDPTCADYVLNQVPDTAGLYRGKLPVVASEAGSNFGTFNIVSAVGTWAVISQNSYGAGIDGSVLTPDTTMQIFGPVHEFNQHVIKVDITKDYEYTVDLRNPEMQTITVKDLTPVAPTFPEKLYAYGTFEKEWDPTCADYFLPQVADTVGLYRGTLPLVDDNTDEGNYAFFNFLSAVGSWKIAAESAFGPAEDATEVVAGTALQIFDATAPNDVNQNTIKVDLNKQYIFTVDLRNHDMMTVTVEDVTPAPEPGVTEPTLTQIAKFTEGLPDKNEARQGMRANGTMNIFDKSKNQYTVWNENGLVKTVATDASVKNTGITADEAGNVIFTDKVFPGAGAPSKLIVYPADGSEMVTIDLTGVPDVKRVDYYGKVRGNILSGEAMMFLPVTGTASFVVLPFYDGQLLSSDVSIITMANVDAADQSTIVYAIGDDADGNIEVIYNKRNGGIKKITIAAGLEGGYELVDDTYVVSATGRNSANGCDAFKLGEKQYILYPSQTNYLDGFSIAELNNAEGNPEVVKFTETLTSNPNGIQSNWVFAQVINNTTANIFQYVPGGYVAVYKFQVPAEVTPEPTPTYPEKLYIFGGFSNWQPSQDADKIFNQDAATPGVYTAEFSLPSENTDNTAYFMITNNLESYFSNTIGPNADGDMLTAGTPMAIFTGKMNSVQVNGDKVYTYTIDLRDAENMTITATEKSGVAEIGADDVKVIAGVGEINIIGNATNVAVYSANGVLISANEATVNCAAGIYLVNVNGKVVKVAVR